MEPVSSYAFTALRFGITYDPPTITLEYSDAVLGSRLRKVHLKDLGPTANVARVAEKVMAAFPKRLDPRTVNALQVQRLLQRLVDRQRERAAAALDSARVDAAAAAAADSDSATAAEAETDLNRVSAEALVAAKARMAAGFERNRVVRGSAEFVYDVRREFRPDPSAANDWDDD